LVSGSRIAPAEEQQQPGQADGDGREQDMKADIGRELDSREDQGVKNHGTSPAIRPTRPALTHRHQVRATRSRFCVANTASDKTKTKRAAARWRIELHHSRCHWLLLPAVSAAL